LQDHSCESEEEEVSTETLPAGFPPTFDEVLKYAEQQAMPEIAKKFHLYFTESGWLDSRGRKVTNWRQKFLTWKNNERPPKILPDSTTGKPKYIKGDKTATATTGTFCEKDFDGDDAECDCPRCKGGNK